MADITYAKPERLFPGTWFKKAAKMLRADLDAAEIAYVTDEGFADFHSLRHTFVSNLAAGGVHPKLAQQLARHSTIALTLDRYTHVGLLDMNSALESLPNITAPESQTMRATGTTDQAASDFSCTKSCTHPAENNRSQPFPTVADVDDARTTRSTNKPRFPGENEALCEDSDPSESVKVVGLEPTTYGLKVRGKARKNADISSVVAQMVATDTPENGCERLMSLAETDPELARLVSAWPKLSAVVKRMILAALEADQG